MVAPSAHIARIVLPTSQLHRVAGKGQDFHICQGMTALGANQLAIQKHEVLTNRVHGPLDASIQVDEKQGSSNG